MGYHARAKHRALVETVCALSWRLRVGIAVVAVAGLSALGFAAAGGAFASTPGCTSLGSVCGAEVNVFGNAFDVYQQKAAYNNAVLSRPNGNDPATDWVRSYYGNGIFRFEYSPNGHLSGLCASDPGQAVFNSDPDTIVLRSCNTGPFQKFRTSAGSPARGWQFTNVATGLVLHTNGTGQPLSDSTLSSGAYFGGSFWTWTSGAPAHVTSFKLYANQDSSATCTTAGNPVLTAGTAYYTSAQVDVVHPATLAPSSAPTLTASAFGGGAPRWVIELHNGNTIDGVATSTAGDLTWSVNNGTTYSTYAKALAAGDSGDSQVTSAFIVDDNSLIGGTTLTGISYDGVKFASSDC